MTEEIKVEYNQQIEKVDEAILDEELNKHFNLCITTKTRRDYLNILDFMSMLAKDTKCDVSLMLQDEKERLESVEQLKRENELYHKFADMKEKYKMPDMPKQDGL